jgi:hypothetical protein
MGRHAILARSQGAQCLQCHQQSMCTSCHSKVAPAAPARLFPEQVEKSLIHRGDFLSTHAIEAKSDGAVCLRCHKTDYCESCHRANAMAFNSSNQRNPHPAGWGVPGNGKFHGPEARLHIETCAACHDQGAKSVCVECHKVGGIGGSPHPANWRKHHDRDDVRSNPMCLTCHTTGL